VRRGTTHSDCRLQTSLYGVLVPYVYNSFVRQILIEGKYQFSAAVFDDIANVLWRGLSIDSKDLASKSIITFVPSSGSRQRWRGFNQAELLAQTLAKLANSPCLPILRKNLHEKQVGQNRRYRLDLARNAYSVNNTVHEETRRIMVVDDVMTTGATLESCAAALNEAFPAVEVYGLVFARGT
jgi:ComF family protein